VIAGRVVLRGTMRYFEDHVRQLLRENLERACAIADTLGGKCDLEYRQGFPPVVNDREKTEIALAAIAESFGAEHIRPVHPFMGAEDFALMLQEAPGAFIWLGAALESPREHHHPEFNIDEGVLVKGSVALAAIALRAMQPEEK
jgi:metal-dependent amidase/aminoacylase/carboxypeptidase family protein